MVVLWPITVESTAPVLGERAQELVARFEGASVQQSFGEMFLSQPTGHCRVNSLLSAPQPTSRSPWHVAVLGALQVWHVEVGPRRFPFAIAHVGNQADYGEPGSAGRGAET